jgi:hypothetical protein
MRSLLTEYVLLRCQVLILSTPKATHPTTISVLAGLVELCACQNDLRLSRKHVLFSNEYKGIIRYLPILAHSRITISCIQVNNVDSFAFDGRVECVLWRCPEVSAMKVPERSS